MQGPRLAGEQGIDAALAAHSLDALVAPTNTPAWPTDLINGDAFLFGSSSFAAVAGYPLVSVTAGFSFGLPVGISFMASAWSEPTLIRIASGFEAAANVRRRPQFLRTFKDDDARRTSALSSADARMTASTAQRQAAKIDAFLVPRVRRMPYL